MREKLFLHLKIAVLTTQPDKDGIIKIDTKIAEESIQKNTLSMTDQEMNIMTLLQLL